MIQLFNINNHIIDTSEFSNLLHDDIVVEFDLFELTQNDWEILKMLPEIIEDNGKIGKFTLEIFDVTITSLKTYEKELIKCNLN